MRCTARALFPCSIQSQPPFRLQTKSFEDTCIWWKYLWTNPIICTSSSGPFPILDEVVGLLPPSQASEREGRSYPVALGNSFSRPLSRTNGDQINDQASQLTVNSSVVPIPPIFPASFVLTPLPALTGQVIFDKVEATSTVLVLLLHHLLTLSHWRQSNYS